MENVLVMVIGCLIAFLQACILLIMNGMNKKIESLCVSNTKEHDSIWKRLYGHKHSDCGDVVVPHESV